MEQTNTVIKDFNYKDNFSANYFWLFVSLVGLIGGFIKQVEWLSIISLVIIIVDIIVLVFDFRHFGFGKISLTEANNLRKSFVKLKQEFKSKNIIDDTTGVAKLPAIQLMIENGNIEVHIRLLPRYQSVLDGLDFSSCFYGYLVDSTYLSNDSNWYCLQLSKTGRVQRKFDSVEDFYSWVDSTKNKDTDVVVDDYNVIPLRHYMIFGATRSGKSYWVRNLLLQLKHMNNVDVQDIKIIDPKRSSLSSLASFNGFDELSDPNILDNHDFCEKIVENLENVVAEMGKTNVAIRNQMLETGDDTLSARDCGFHDRVIVVDEVASLLKMFDRKQLARFSACIDSLLMMGAQANFWVVLITQKFDTGQGMKTSWRGQSDVFLFGNNDAQTIQTAQIGDCPNRMNKPGEGWLRLKSDKAPRWIQTPFIKM